MSTPKHHNCRCGKPKPKGMLFCEDCMVAYRKLWEQKTGRPA